MNAFVLFFLHVSYYHCNIFYFFFPDFDVWFQSISGGVPFMKCWLGNVSLMVWLNQKYLDFLDLGITRNAVLVLGFSQYHKGRICLITNCNMFCYL